MNSALAMAASFLTFLLHLPTLLFRKKRSSPSVAMLRSAIASSSSLTASLSPLSLVEKRFGGLPHEAATSAIAVWISRMLGMIDVSLSTSSSSFLSSPCFLFPMFGLPAIFLFFASIDGSTASPPSTVHPLEKV